MEMDVPPLAVLSLPDPGFFERISHGVSVAANALIQTDVADHSDVSHNPHFGSADSRLSGRSFTAELEVKPVKFEPLDELTTPLRLERRQRRVAKPLIGRPVALRDRVEQPLIGSQKLLAHRVHCRLLGLNPSHAQPGGVGVTTFIPNDQMRLLLRNSYRDDNLFLAPWASGRTADKLDRCAKPGTTRRTSK